MDVMYLAADYVHPYEADASLRSRCRVRLYLPSEDKDAAVVICSELSNNPGTSVTKAAQLIAAEIIEHFKLPEPPVWIEHYPKEATDGEAEQFDLVVFAHYEVAQTMRGGAFRKEIGRPTWKRLDRASVEVIVGAKV
jgi:hypothetical protein